jgi:hypothetical protein
MAAPHTEFFDRLSLCDLLSRYYRAIDDKRLELIIIQATFLQEGRIVRPNGSVLKGWQDILDGQSKSFARFRATHHVLTNHVTDIQGDTAKMQANITAVHLWEYDQCDPHALESHFVAGGVLSVFAERTVSSGEQGQA